MDAVAVKIAREPKITPPRCRSRIISNTRFHIHVGRFFVRALFWALIVSALLVSLVAFVLRFGVLPNVERYQVDIISRAAASSGMDVSAGAIRGGWAGFRPYIEIDNLVFLEPASSTSEMRPAGATALRLPQVRASLSWWSLLVGQIRFAQVSLQAPELALTRAKDGLIYFAGQAINQANTGEEGGQLLPFLLAQPGLRLQGARLTWRDDFSDHSELIFSDVGLRIEKFGAVHQLGFIATPPAALARRVEAAGELRLENIDGQWRVVGQLFASAAEANLAEVRKHISIPNALQSGVGNVRAWVDIDNSAMALATAAVPPVGSGTLSPLTAANTAANAATRAAPTTAAAPAPAPAIKYAATNDVSPAFNPIRLITADVNLVNARVQLRDDLSPLNLAKLAGRIEYQAREGGFSIGSKGLEILTRDGVALPTADFSLAMQNLDDAARAKGEISGDGIDLNVVAALLQYFPVGKAVREFVGDFSPRGVVRQTVFSWTGFLEKPSSYRIKGALSDFGVRAFGKIPGVSNFSGTVEGDEKGGKFAVAAKELTLDVPELLRAPLGFATFEGDGSWQVTAEAIAIDLARVNFANDDLSGEIIGRYSRLRGETSTIPINKQAGFLDIKGKLARVKAIRVGKYLPNGIAQTRDYLERAIRDGEMTSANFQVKGDLYQFPFHNGKGGEFKAVANVANVDFRYADDWPAINDIGAEMLFENTKFSVKSNTARILNTRLGATTIVINDLIERPQIIEISTKAEARAEDVSRFLRASPLANSVGAFTRIVALEGPGNLELALKIPLGGKDTVKVNGKYSVVRATAKTTIGPAVTGLSGGVIFTEVGVKSFAPGTAGASAGSNTPDGALQGTAYGNPFTLAINGGGDTGIATEFAARAELAQLSDVLPFRLPQQLSGTTNFNGRILSNASGTEVTIDSTLIGVTSVLPYPLAKRADEARALRVQFNDVAQPAEAIRVTLAGNATDNTSAAVAAVATASLAAPTTADLADSRIDARFKRKFGVNGVAQGLLGGIATVGVPAVGAAIPEGLWFEGSLKRFDFDSWLKAFKGLYPQSAAETVIDKPTGDAFPIAGFDFKLGTLIAYGRPFASMDLKGRKTSEEWRFVVDSAEAAGDFSWRPGAFSDRGALRARLSRFVLNEESLPPTALQPVVETVREADFPALDIIAESFTQKDRWLGKLELRATPQGGDWKIDQLSISNGHVKLDMDGLWQRTDQLAGATPQSRTAMNIKLESPNLNALFTQFGFGEQMRGGTGTLEGKLSWPGHVYQLQLSNLSGDFRISARNGQFAKIEPGAGKLLGLMSLQSLPRRLTLDFRDLFAGGFAFNTIDGDFNVKEGIMFTENFQLVGPAAGVRMSGDISLPSERQNLIVTVVPKLDESVALGAGIATLNPLVGLAVFLGQKALQGPVEKIFSFRLAVSGTWDNPQVDRIVRGTPLPLPAGVDPTPPATLPPDVPATPTKPEPVVNTTTP